MKITKEWLTLNQACAPSIEEWNKEGIVEIEAIPLLKKLCETNHYDWANWLLGRVLNKKQFKLYIVFALQAWLKPFVEKYPKDTTLPAYVNAVIENIKNPSEENRNRADRAYRAYRAYLADLAYLADRAYRADLAYRAYRAYRADLADRAYRAYLADLAYLAEIRKTIVEYGIKLLEEVSE